MLAYLRSASEIRRMFGVPQHKRPLARGAWFRPKISMNSLQTHADFLNLPDRFMEFMKRTEVMEGGWSNNPSDPGGATMYGISTRSNPELAQEIENKTLTREKAFVHIYNKYYVSIPQVNYINASIAFLVFDAKFHGMKEVIKQIQSLINIALKGRVSPLVIDGVWGRRSASAASLLSREQSAKITESVFRSSENLGQLAAARVLKYQKRHNLPLHNYSKGFKNRNVRRSVFAKELAHV